MSLCKPVLDSLSEKRRQGGLELRLYSRLFDIPVCGKLCWNLKEGESKLRILVVNDDGIRSPGIAALAGVAAQLGETYVVAPHEQCSGMSQKLSIFEELALREACFPVRVAGAWSLTGTPADCVKIALDQVLDFKPDYVFSGVNDGWNAGFDIAYSGTVGACFEAVMNGIPAMAFSARSKSELDIAERYMPEIAAELIDRGQGRGEIWNVNFPSGPVSELRGILRERFIAPMQLYNGVFTACSHPDGHTLISQKGVPIEKGAAPAGSDIAAVLDGYISIGKIVSPVMV